MRHSEEGREKRKWRARGDDGKANDNLNHQASVSISGVSSLPHEHAIWQWHPLNPNWGFSQTQKQKDKQANCQCCKFKPKYRIQSQMNPFNSLISQNIYTFRPSTKLVWCELHVSGFPCAAKSCSLALRRGQYRDRVIRLYTHGKLFSLANQWKLNCSAG